MTLARPLADDPVLLGRQREMAALKVVGSGVDASAVGTGKTITSGRALAHRATTHRRASAGMVVAEGRLLGAVARRAHPRRARARAAAAGAEPRAVSVLDERPAGRRADPPLRPRARRAPRRACWWPTACSTATPPTCRRSPGTC